ncbi:MAG: UMP kinase [Treponema sp.]|nr:UMP kinase [Treponema sp.]
MITKVLSVGGSIIAPDKPDVSLLKDFTSMALSWLKANEGSRLILVAGGGGPARTYQNAYREVASLFDSDEKASCGFASEDEENYACDWLGIMATRMNAQILKTCFGPLCPSEVVTDPTAAPDEFPGRVLVAAGWKPGFSTDNDAVILAKKYNADVIVNLSNIEKVFTDDPRKNPDAKPLDTISWADFRKMVGDKWVPGKNCPFDPIASKGAEEGGLEVICAAGKNISNIRAILDGKDFIGTSIK